MRTREFTKKTEIRRLLAVAEANIGDSMPLIRDVFEAKSAEGINSRLYKLKYAIKDVRELVKD